MSAPLAVPLKLSNAKLVDCPKCFAPYLRVFPACPVCQLIALTILQRPAYGDQLAARETKALCARSPFIVGTI